MKKAKLLMAVACLFFFAALVYTNLPTEEDKQEDAANYARKMVEIKTIKTTHPPIYGPETIKTLSKNVNHQGQSTGTLKE